MTVFLSLKQIVDMLYYFKILDFGMVFFALLLIGYQFIGKKQYINVKDKITVSDISVLLLAILVGISFCRNTSAWAEVCKIESTLMVFFFGRVYGEKILSAGKWLARVGYGIIVINGLYYLFLLEEERFCLFGTDKGYANIRNGGALYYFKTDLAVAIIIASIFIYAFGVNKVLKLLTLYFFNTLILINTYARMGTIAYFLFLLIISAIEIINKIQVIYKKKETSKILEKKQRSHSLNNTGNSNRVLKYMCLAFVVLLLILAIVVRLSIINKYTFRQLNISEEQDTMLENIFHSRHVIWWDTLNHLSNSSIITKLTGESMSSLEFAGYNGRHMMSHCLYLSLLFGTGLLGICTFVVCIFDFIQKEISTCNRTMSFVSLTLLAMFLIFGFTTEAMEYTQMSWFPFIFAGASVTMSKRNATGRINE